MPEREEKGALGSAGQALIAAGGLHRAQEGAADLGDLGRDFALSSKSTKKLLEGCKLCFIKNCLHYGSRDWTREDRSKDGAMTPVRRHGGLD